MTFCAHVVSIHLLVDAGSYHLAHAGEGNLGPVVKMIMDHPRCAQLLEGDVLLEVNGENVRSYAHNELVTVLKRCPKGNQATFVVLRQPSEVRGGTSPFCVCTMSCRNLSNTF